MLQLRTGTLVHHEQTARLSSKTDWCEVVTLGVSAHSVCTATPVRYEQAVKLS